MGLNFGAVISYPFPQSLLYFPCTPCSRTHLGSKVLWAGCCPYPSTGSPAWRQEVATSGSLCPTARSLNLIVSLATSPVKCEIMEGILFTFVGAHNAHLVIPEHFHCKTEACIKGLNWFNWGIVLKFSFICWLCEFNVRGLIKWF